MVPSVQSSLSAPYDAEQLLEYASTALAQATSLYYGHGTDNYHDEAYACVMHVLGLNPSQPWDAAGITVQAKQVLQVQQLIEQRIRQQIPMPYLLGQAWFANLAFYVDQRVLIPRSPLAELIQQGLQPWLGDGKVDKILELGTGSGCIAIACAYAFKNARVDASDISAEVLKVAADNVARHQLQDRVALYQADLFSGLVPQTYDIIISNPPYVAQTEIDNLAKEYQYEPSLALAGGGEDGLEIVARLLSQAKAFLAPTGLLIVEVGDRQAELMQRFPDLPFIWHEFSRGGEGVFILSAQDLA